jgi:hypothetical protein
VTRGGEEEARSEGEETETVALGLVVKAVENGAGRSGLEG